MYCQHVIVGDGVTAAEFATTRTYKPGDHVTIIGPNVTELGRGVAYAKALSGAPWQYAYLLNSPARSVDTDFGEWIAQNWEHLRSIMSGRSPDWLGAAQPYIQSDQYASLNAPREIYGDFFHARTVKKIEAMRCNGIQVQLLASRVACIKPSSSGLSIFTTDNQKLEATSVDVATGGPQNQRFPGDDGEHSFPTLFGHEFEIAEKLKSGGSIVSIGTGAAMLDLLRFCQSVQSEAQIKFIAISPKGKMLKALRPSGVFKPTKYDLTGTFDCADGFLMAIFALQQQALASGDTLYETRVGLRNLFMNKGLIEFVPDVIEARKVSRPLFKHFEGGTRDSIDDFNRLTPAGHTRLIAGKVQHIEHRNGEALVYYSDASDQTQLVNAAVVVNCAGPGHATRFDVLTDDMLAKNWISICAQSGGILVGAGGQTSVNGVRYLGPAVTSIGNSVEPVPLYDVNRLRTAVQKFNKLDN